MHFCLDWHLSENEKNPIDFFNGLPRAPIPQWTLDFLVPNGNQALKEFFCLYLLAFYPMEKDRANYLRQQCNGFPSTFYFVESSFLKVYGQGCNIVAVNISKRGNFWFYHPHPASSTLFLQLISQYSKKGRHMKICFCLNPEGSWVGQGDTTRVF